MDSVLRCGQCAVYTGVDMDLRKQELAEICVFAASCAGAAWFLDMEFFTLVFMIASAFAGIAGLWRLMH